MKCSECGKIIRPVASVDIDGVLGNYHDHFVSFAQQYTGDMLRWDYPGEPLEFSEHLEMRKEDYREVKMAYRQGGMKRSMPLISGARQFMRHLRQLDIEVWIATTRPWQRLDNIDPDTRHWLARYEIPYEYMIYGENKYEQLFKLVDEERILCVIDDEYSNCVEASRWMNADTERVWQPDQPWTSACPWPNQFRTFTQMAKIIEDHKKRWEEEHATTNEQGAGSSHQAEGEASEEAPLTREEVVRISTQGHVSPEEDPC